MSGEILIKRNVKDSVFTHLFQEKQYVLQLYQALHPEALDVTEDMIEIVTLENVLIDASYNDLGFLIDQHLVVLVEAQSTWTVNIIPRALMYLAQTYQDYIAKEALNVYGSRPLPLPKPELYVIYTGNKRIEKEVISLSEEFFGGEPTDLEVRVRVLTDGENGDILYQYVAFTKVLDDQIREKGRSREAISETIRICKDRDVLRQYLTEHEQEVRSIMISLFDNETLLKAYTKEVWTEGQDAGLKRGLEQGLERGLEQGLEQGLERGQKNNAMETAKKMLQKGMPMDLIEELSGLSLSEIHKLEAQLAK